MGARTLQRSVPTSGGKRYAINIEAEKWLFGGLLYCSQTLFQLEGRAIQGQNGLILVYYWSILLLENFESVR